MTQITGNASAPTSVNDGTLTQGYSASFWLPHGFPLLPHLTLGETRGVISPLERRRRRAASVAASTADSDGLPGVTGPTLGLAIPLNAPSRDHERYRGDVVSGPVQHEGGGGWCWGGGRKLAYMHGIQYRG